MLRKFYPTGKLQRVQSAAAKEQALMEKWKSENQKTEERRRDHHSLAHRPHKQHAEESGHTQRQAVEADVWESIVEEVREVVHQAVEEQSKAKEEGEGHGGSSGTVARKSLVKKQRVGKNQGAEEHHEPVTPTKRLPKKKMKMTKKQKQKQKSTLEEGKTGAGGKKKGRGKRTLVGTAAEGTEPVRKRTAEEEVEGGAPARKRAATKEKGAKKKKTKKPKMTEGVKTKKVKKRRLTGRIAEGTIQGARTAGSGE